MVIEGYRAKNGTEIENGGNVVPADGRKLFVGSSGRERHTNRSKRSDRCQLAGLT